MDFRRKVDELNISPCEFSIITSITDFLGPDLTQYLLYRKKHYIIEYFEKIKTNLHFSLSNLPSSLIVLLVICVNNTFAQKNEVNRNVRIM